MKKNKFTNNLKYAFIAQFISMLFSMLMYLLVPKIMGKIDYAYWQLFLLYSNYSGFFHLGLVDGIYLKIGGKDEQDLDYSLLGCQMKCMTIFHLVIFSFVQLCVIYSNIEIERKFLICCVCVYIIFYCVNNFFGFIFQAINQTKTYSISVIIEKTICLLGVVLLVLLGANNFKVYVLLFLSATIVASLFFFVYGSKFIFSKFRISAVLLSEMKQNVQIGCILMFSGLAGAFIIGSGRMMVDNYWGIEAFGEISFSISMINLVLLFLRQVSMVLFPMLRQLNSDKQIKIYNSTIAQLTLILPLVYFCYIPAKFIFQLWLPQYVISLQYLGVLLPICIYDGKMQMLFNTYLKVLRKEKMLLAINLTALASSITISYLALILFSDVYAVACAIVISIGIRSVLTECYFSVQFKSKENLCKKIIFESFFTISMMIGSWLLSDFSLIILLSFVYFVYVVFSKTNRELLVNDFSFIKLHVLRLISTNLK